MVQSGTYTSHRAAFLDQPFAAPHQSAGSEVPSDSFPPGEAKRCKPLACTLYYRWREPFNERLSRASVRADAVSRLTWFTLCAITWFTPSVEGVYQKVSSFKCVDTFVNVNPPYAEFSKNQGNLSLGTGFTHSDFFSTKSLT